MCQTVVLCETKYGVTSTLKQMQSCMGHGCSHVGKQQTNTELSVEFGGWDGFRVCSSAATRRQCKPKRDQNIGQYRLASVLFPLSHISLQVLKLGAFYQLRRDQNSGYCRVCGAGPPYFNFIKHECPIHVLQFPSLGYHSIQQHITVPIVLQKERFDRRKVNVPGLEHFT